MGYSSKFNNMATTIAQYFTDEMVDWQQSISFYREELNELGQKLFEVIRRNTIVDIAARAGVHQSLLDEISYKFSKLQLEIELQEAKLKTDSTLVDNTLINNETENHQAELRRKMRATEKEFIDVKFECYNFLYRTLKK